MRWIFLSWCLILASCGPGTSDHTMHLTHGYSLVASGGPDIRIYYMNDVNGNGVYITPTVISYSYNDKHLAVLRQPFDRDKSGVDDTTPYSVDKYMINECEYWLIDVREHKKTGPYEKDDFMALIKDLDIDTEKLDIPLSNGVSTYCVGHFINKLGIVRKKK